MFIGVKRRLNVSLSLKSWEKGLPQNHKMYTRAVSKTIMVEAGNLTRNEEDGNEIKEIVLMWMTAVWI